MNLTAIQTSIIAIIGGIAAIGGALIWGHETEQIIISSAAVIIPAVIAIVAQIENKTTSAERIATQQLAAHSEPRGRARVG